MGFKTVFWCVSEAKGKCKDKVYPRTGHDSPDGG